MGYKASHDKEKSSGQIKRESYDYRKNYIKHNSGILGSIYICSQCGKIMSRTTMQVDHIFPISRWWSINRVVNCVSICPECNKKKSDKITKSMTAKALIHKLLEEIVIVLQNLILLLFRALFILLLLLIRMLISPLKTDRSLVQKAIIVASYCFIASIVIKLF